MKLRHRLLAIAGVLALAGTTYAQSATVNFGLSSQDLTETGIGDNGAGRAQWFINQGACAVAGNETTCTLSGTFTGTTAGFTNGTYALVTTYAGSGPTYDTGLGGNLTNGPSPLIGISSSPGSSFFNFEFLPSTATMVLDLNQTGGADSVIPIFSAGSFVNGYTLSDAGIPVCSPSTVICTPFFVGETPGATFADTVTGDATFALSSVIPAPEPSSLALLGAGLFGILGIARRKLSLS